MDVLRARTGAHAGRHLKRVLATRHRRCKIGAGRRAPLQHPPSLIYTFLHSKSPRSLWINNKKIPLQVFQDRFRVIVDPRTTSSCSHDLIRSKGSKHMDEKICIIMQMMEREIQKKNQDSIHHRLCSPWFKIRPSITSKRGGKSPSMKLKSKCDNAHYGLGSGHSDGS